MRVRVWAAAAVTGLVAVTGACATSPSPGGRPTTTTTTSTIPAPPGVDQQAGSAGSPTTASAGQSASCTNPAAQTFTAGRTGGIYQVSFVDGQAFAFVARVSVQTVDGADHPTGVELGYGTLNGFGPLSGPQWFDVPMVSPVAVTSGVHYALVFTPVNCATDPSLVVVAQYDTDLYAGGQAWTEEPGWVTESSWLGSFISPATGLDFYFKTWVG